MTGKATRNTESQRVHDIVVKLIADHRFDVGDWKIVINPAAESNDAIEHDDGLICADIVARFGDDVVALGEVETAESVSDEEVAQWLELAHVCSRLYLFVPEGSEQVAAELIEKHGVRCAGLRAYALRDDDTVSVQSVFVRNGHSKWNDHPWWMNVGQN